jgi:triacylglycerol lipase
MAAVAVVTAVAVPARAAERDPVIFVHGYTGSGSNWNTMVSRFRAAGYAASELDAWTYNFRQSNQATAADLSAEVDRVLARTGATKVDIVSHSMGGLSSRWYLKFLGGTAKVDDWVSLGGPNHGTSSANFCFDRSCFDMRAGSSFLTTLNAGDESPGAVGYGTFWSACDGVIIPATSTIVSGATNTQIGCVSHLSLLTNADLATRVRAFVL